MCQSQRFSETKTPVDAHESFLKHRVVSLFQVAFPLWTTILLLLPSFAKKSTVWRNSLQKKTSSFWKKTNRFDLCTNFFSYSAVVSSKDLLRGWRFSPVGYSGAVGNLSVIALHQIVMTLFIRHSLSRDLKTFVWSAMNLWRSLYMTLHAVGAHERYSQLLRCVPREGVLWVIVRSEHFAAVVERSVLLPLMLFF